MVPVEMLNTNSIVKSDGNVKASMTGIRASDLSAFLTERDPKIDFPTIDIATAMSPYGYMSGLRKTQRARRAPGRIAVLSRPVSASGNITEMQISANAITSTK